MNDLCTRFGQALAEAEHQLHWGTDLARIEQAASELRSLDGSHVLVRHLSSKMTRLVAAQRKLKVDRRSPAAD